MKGTVEGVRNFMKVDNYCVLHVGHLEGRHKVVQGTKTKARRGSPEVLIREGPEGLTLRAEEVNTQKSCINVDHIAQDRWGPPLVDADWHAFCQAIHQGIEGKD